MNGLKVASFNACMKRVSHFSFVNEICMSASIMYYSAFCNINVKVGLLWCPISLL